MRHNSAALKAFAKILKVAPLTEMLDAGLA